MYAYKKELSNEPIEPINNETIFSKLSHAELVKVCSRSLSHPAWDEFHRRFDRYIKIYVKKEIKRWAASFEMDSSLAQEILCDLTQTVYLKLLEDNQQALQNFKGEKENSFLAYLARIAVNIV